VLVQDCANNETSQKYLFDFANALNREAEDCHYADKKNVFLINSAVPFEDGVLFSAYELGDGERYCSLYYIENGDITYHTLMSDCWSFNYTVFRNHTIAFGLSSEGTYGFGEGSLPDSVTVWFADGTTASQRFSNIPSKIVEGCEYFRQFGSGGYILVADGQTWIRDIKFYDKNGRERDDWRTYLKETDGEVYAWRDRAHEIWNYSIFNVMYGNDYGHEVNAVAPVRIYENGEELETEDFLLGNDIGLEYVWRNRNCYFYRGISKVHMASEIEIKGLRDGDDVLWVALDRDDGSTIQDYATLCSREAPAEKGNYMLIVRHNGSNFPVFENMYFTRCVRIV